MDLRYLNALADWMISIFIDCKRIRMHGKVIVVKGLQEISE
jgi:hypothetical protein